MSKIIYLLLFVSANLFSQVPPQGISHRGTVYNTNGSLVADADVKIKVEIIDYITSPAQGTIIFSEIFSVHTNAFGHYNINLGNSTPQSNLLFSQINWGNNTSKYLAVSIDPLNGNNFTIIGGNQLLSVPYALFSQTSQTSTTSMTVYKNIPELRTKTGNFGDIVYIKGHTNFGDGGEGNFIWKDIPANDPRFNDNDGTIVRPVGSETTGWFRLIDGRINVRYFGTIGFDENDGNKIQKAIDFASKNADRTVPANGVYFINKTNAGTVVYIPAGNYKIKNALVLKNGVSIEGESLATTTLTATGQADGNMIEMDAGVLSGVNVSNLTLTGGERTAENTRNCIYLKARAGSGGDGSGNDGGIWSSTFKNIAINQFSGSGIILEGGGGNNYNYKLPNQDIIFEQVNVKREKDNATCLLMRGQQGQITFINCGFDGAVEGSLGSTFNTSKFANVVIESKDHVQSAIVKFLTCTFQYSEYGAYIKFAENITFDNCWFELLDRSVGITNAATIPPLQSKGINIINSRFANASGFGSYHDKVLNRNDLNGNPTGSCIYLEGGQVNVQGNYVAVSTTFNEHNLFIGNYSADSQINASNNSFQQPILGKTYGIANNIINSSGNSLNTKGYRFVTVNSSSSQINDLKSDLSAGETLTIRSNGNYLKFDNSKNIILTKPSPVSLAYGETATFIKVDGTFVNSGITYNETWQLVGINKVN